MAEETVEVVVRAGRFSLPKTRLLGSDQVPMSLKAQDWGYFKLISTYIGLIVCIPALLMAGGAFLAGLNWIQVFIVAVGVSLLMTALFYLNGEAGIKYGVPYTVIARSSF